MTETSDQTGEPAEIADLPVEVRRLVHAVDRLQVHYAETTDRGRHVLINDVYRANAAVWARPLTK